MSLKIQNLVKIYGTQSAVNDISFEANQGEIVGFLGPNGAGKSTTMKIATCYLTATSGKIEVCGYDVQQAQESLVTIVETGEAGAGMVIATVNGKKQIPCTLR
eukprot:Opistho-2@13631